MNPSAQPNPLLQKLEQSNNNPLREGIGPRRTSRELVSALTNRPITPENVRAIALERRVDVLNAFKDIFVPTRQTLEVAIAMQDMLFEGLDRRDPRVRENRTFLMATAALKGKGLNEVPAFARPEAPALGMLLEGISGTGKSAVVERLLGLFPQVVDHGANPACGWMSFRQLVYLRVHMPSDGTRGGFLTSAFLEIDKALGTGYSDEYRRLTVEKKLVLFLHVLSVHRCGLLVIEEAQQRALSEVGPQWREFLTFFLRLLNFGIPTVLVGNPLAFVTLNMFSQDACRFTESGAFRLEPEMDPGSKDWRTRWIPNLWGPTLLDEPDAPYKPISEHPLDQTLEGFIWRRTAGFPRFVSRLRSEVQAHALALGRRQVSADLVDEVFRTSPKFNKVRGLIDAFVRKDARALKSYIDIYPPDYDQLWRAQPLGSGGASEASGAELAQARPGKAQSAEGAFAGGAGHGASSKRRSGARSKNMPEMDPQQQLINGFKDYGATA